MHNINMRKLLKANERYNLNIKQISNNSAIVTTGLGEWMIEVEEPSIHNKKYIVLKHKHLCNRDDKFHFQHRFYDYVWTLGHIDFHDSRRFKKKIFK